VHERFSGPAIAHSSFGFVLVHNHPSGVARPSEADLQLTRRILAGAHILEINFLDHVIVGQPMEGRRGYFSFQEAGLLQTPAVLEEKQRPNGFMTADVSFKFVT
jgi:RadC-like JAB domain